MKRYYWFVGLIVLLLLLSSCKQEINIVKPSCPSPSLNIVAELPSDLKVPLNDFFEIRIGYGQAAKWYNYATLEIFATDFEITDSQGNVHKDNYICTISDFSDDRFFITDSTNYTDTCYYDTFKFKYTGENPEASGGISVWLTTLQHGEPSTPAEQNQGPEGVLVEFFYKVKDQQVTLSPKK